MLVSNSNISLKISTFGSRDIVGQVAVRPAIYGVLYKLSIITIRVLYLARLRRCRASNILGSRHWPFGVTWRHRSRDHL